MTRRDYIFETFASLSERLRDVRILCGDWTRAVTPSVTERHGMTAIFLDPPYGVGAMDYSVGGNTCDGLAQSVARWAIANGDNPLLRICVAGYEGAVTFPDDWECVEWVARSGYGGGRGNEADANRRRERLWFSPACLKPDRQQLDLFAT